MELNNILSFLEYFDIIGLQTYSVLFSDLCLVNDIDIITIRPAVKKKASNIQDRASEEGRVVQIHQLRKYFL